MKTQISFILILFFIYATTAVAQYNGNQFAISLNYNYTTTSKLFLQPNSADPFVKSTHDNLDDICSYSAEFRYRVSEPIIVGLSVEFIEKTYTNRNFNLSGTQAVLKDGYRAIPIELSLYYLLPFSTESFKFFMGGGSGIYFGKHIRQIGDVSITNEGVQIGFGIHVAVGMDYFITKYFSVRGQMRFRDPEFEMKSKYTSNIVNYNGTAFFLSKQEFDSKVNIDGVTFTIGAVLHF